MAIDGRTIKRQQQDDAATRAYESKSIGLIAALIVWVPLGLFAWFTYWSGTFFGGVWGGIGSLFTTAATIGGIYAYRRLRRH